MNDDAKHRTDQEHSDELLEAVWTCREDGDVSVEAVLGATHGEATAETLDALRRRQLVDVVDEQVLFTEQGEQDAAQIIRRHRLAERLLVSALGMSADQTEELACAFEHHAMPQLTDSICTLLGHPTECPHGKPIPPGPDCAVCNGRRTEELVPLPDVPAAGSGRVAHLRTRDHDRLHQLLAMGISPGVTLRVHQRTPVFVVQVDQSEFAMDRQVAEDIYVWLAPGQKEYP